MVREIDSDVVIEDVECAEALRIPSAKPAELSQKEQLSRAFERFAKSHPRLSFDKCVAEWVKSRVELGFTVDDDDPAAQTPSNDFRAFLRKRFARIQPEKKR